MKIKSRSAYVHLVYLLAGTILGAAVMFVSWTKLQITELAGPTERTCIMSGGEFENGSCVCPIETELGQTQEMMYDESTGFCQTTFGGPGGNALQASAGLPWGMYTYYNDIINYWCDESGGSKSGAACICSSSETYDKSTGQCR